jgi:hypothetical protein
MANLIFCFTLFISLTGIVLLVINKRAFWSVETKENEPVGLSDSSAQSLQVVPEKQVNTQRFKDIVKYKNLPRILLQRTVVIKNAIAQNKKSIKAFITQKGWGHKTIFAFKSVSGSREKEEIEKVQKIQTEADYWHKIQQSKILSRSKNLWRHYGRAKHKNKKSHSSNDEVASK